MAIQVHRPNGVVPPLDAIKQDKQEKTKKGGKARADKLAKKAEARADRAADNLFRIAHGKHEQLSSMADSKAHTMLTICVAVIGLSATQVFDPLFQFAALVLIASSLMAAGFAVYATMPTLPRHRDADPRDPHFNLVFFSDFCRLPLETFEAEMQSLINDRAAVHRALIHDLYSLGRVLGGKKFRYLAYCYRTFLWGLVLAVVVFAITSVFGQR